MFTRKNVTEHIKDAVEKASSIINEVNREKSYEVRRHQHTVNQAMLAYVQGVGFEAFKQHVANNTTTVNAMETLKELEADVATITEVGKLQENVVIVRRDGHYVVRHGKRTVIMSDDELPMEWRGKLGMLKLVEDKHFVTEVGGRINEDTFVLLAEPNNVSEEGENDDL
jgi:hypothetical protein